jgi:cytochrome P450
VNPNPFLSSRPRHTLGQSSSIAPSNNSDPAVELSTGRGLSLGFHNHHFNWPVELGGRFAWNYFWDKMERRVNAEVDAYWDQAANQNPVTVIQKWGTRARRIHLKDGPCALGEPQVALGEGCRYPSSSTLDPPRLAAWRPRMSEFVGDPLSAPTRASRDAILAHRRAEAPVAPIDSGAYFVATFEGVRQGLLNVDHFVGSFGNTGELPEEETVLPGIPEPRHGKVRKIINTVLAYHHAVALEPFVRETASRMVGDLLEANQKTEFVDLCEWLARPLPSRVIAEVLGVAADDVPRFAAWSDEILERIVEEGQSARLGDLHPEFASYVDDQINARLSHQGAPDDLIKRMLVTDVEGECLSPRAVRTQIVNLIIAGNETTRNLIGNLFYRLALNPPLWKQLRADKHLRAAAVEESLRIDSPVQFLARTCTRAITIEGVELKPGDRVLFGVASANFDEKVFEDPQSFRLDRIRPREHAGFGAGPHLCPGAYLARMEALAALDAAMDQIDSIELDPSYAFDTNPVPFTYGPNSLQVRCSDRSES